MLHVYDEVYCDNISEITIQSRKKVSFFNI